MPKSNDFSQDLLAFLLSGTAWPSKYGLYGAKRWVTLHTSSPGAAGNQSTNECTYSGYSRVGIDTTTITNIVLSANRAWSDWEGIDGTDITASSQTITTVAVGLASAGASSIIYYGDPIQSLVLDSSLGTFDKAPRFFEGAFTALESTSTGRSNTLMQDIVCFVFSPCSTFPATYTADSNLYLGLHTASPGDSGVQTTSEATYTGYARATVPKATSWSGGTLNTDIAFALCTGGSNTITHFSLGLSSSGAGQILYYGQLASPLSVSSGIKPAFLSGSIVITET